MVAGKLSLILGAPMFLANVIGLAGMATAAEQKACRPVLTVTDVRFSKMMRPALERTWSAVVMADASRCSENSSGYFELGFSRLKENAPDMDFSEEFVWLSPSVTVSIDLSADEAVELHWIGKVSTCPCSR